MTLYDEYAKITHLINADLHERRQQFDNNVARAHFNNVSSQLTFSLNMYASHCTLMTSSSIPLSDCSQNPP
jgi:hypothetical protein